MKLFVICEMTSADDIIADATFTGNTKGILPSHLMKPDTFDFAISEGEKDFGVPFRYDLINKNFIIKKSELPLITGERYKFRGIGTNKGLNEPQIVVPPGLKIDTIIIDKFERTVKDGRFHTLMDCRIKIKTPEEKLSYFHIIPYTDARKVFQVKSFLKDISAFKRLKNKPGFLVDHIRMNGDEISVTLELLSDEKPKSLDLEVFNSTRSYYEFNRYMSDVEGSNSYESPPIAGFNVKSDKAYGTFSAKTLSKASVTLK